MTVQLWVGMISNCFMKCALTFSLYASSPSYNFVRDSSDMKCCFVTNQVKLSGGVRFSESLVEKYGGKNGGSNPLGAMRGIMRVCYNKATLGENK